MILGISDTFTYHKIMSFKTDTKGKKLNKVNLEDSEKRQKKALGQCMIIS